MKKVIFLLSILFVFSCRNDTTTTAPLLKNEEPKELVENTSTTIDEKENKTEENANDTELLGYYVGSFLARGYGNTNSDPSFSNKINISIDRIKNDSIYGHSVVAGNSRPFRGVWNKTDFTVKVAEPGDDKYDGVFEFNFLPEKRQIKGTWLANDSNLSVTDRGYTLTRKVFKYDPTLNLSYEEDYDHSYALYQSQNEQGDEMEAISSHTIGKLNASAKELTNQDVENLNKGELEILRNLIYARHGYSFKNRKMRYFFDSKIDWYIPVSTDIRDQLTSIETKNIDLIKRYEQHAERYYDYFGR